MKSILSAVIPFVLHNIQRFLLGALFGGALFASLVGTICYFLVDQEVFWRLATVATLVSIGTMIVAVVTGARFAASQALREWVEASGVGPMLSKVIFKQALGVSDKKPQGSASIATALDGVTLGEAKEILSEEFALLFTSDVLDRWLPAQGRWVAQRLTHAAGWAVASALIQRIPGADRDDAHVDLLALRDGLSEGLADKAVSLMTGRATVIASAVTIGAGVVCVAVAALLGNV